MIVLGVRELPNPKGEGYLYYKLSPSGREYFVDYLNLYETSDEELKAFFVSAFRKVKNTLMADGRLEEISVETVKTENIADWAVKLLKVVLLTIR